jgi:hypothetical protein
MANHQNILQQRSARELLAANALIDGVTKLAGEKKHRAYDTMLDKVLAMASFFIVSTGTVWVLYLRRLL